MLQPRLIAVPALVLAGLVAATSADASAANHLVADYGSVGVPFTHSVGNTFSGSAGTGFTSQDGTALVTASIGGLNYFYDDFIFTLPSSPQANFDAAAVTIDMGSFLGLQNFSARLYRLDAGVSSLTTSLPSSGTPVQAWTSTTLLAPGVNSTTLLFQNVSLQSGASYALEFRGTINGSFGGSYGGHLNIIPVPEPDSAMLLMASLGLFSLVRRVPARLTRTSLPRAFRSP
jgi:hypothetical protein